MISTSADVRLERQGRIIEAHCGGRPRLRCLRAIRFRELVPRRRRERIGRPGVDGPRNGIRRARRRRRASLVLLPGWRGSARAEDGRGQGRRRLQRLASEHPRHVRGRDLRPGQRPAHDRDPVRQWPRRRRAGRHRWCQRLPRPVARPRPAHRQDQLRPVRLPVERRRHLQTRRGPGRYPVRDLPVGPVLQEGHVRRGRPQGAAAQVRRQIHDAGRQPGRLELRHRPEGRQAADGRQEQQGRHPGRVRPEEDRPVGPGAAARRPARHGRLFWAGQARVRRRQDRRDPGRLEGRLEVLLQRHLDRPREPHRAAVREQGHQPQGLSVLQRPYGHERELPVVDIRRR